MALYTFIFAWLNKKYLHLDPSVVKNLFLHEIEIDKSTCAAIKWDPLENTDEYKIESKSETMLQILHSTQSNCVITQLEPSTYYNISVCGKNKNGLGQPSVIAVTTGAYALLLYRILYIQYK